LSTMRFYDRTSSLGMPHGVYDFNKETVEEKVESMRAGNYAIGFLAPMGGFAPKMVGGSDEDLRGELLQRLDIAKQKGYDRFCFRYAKSPQDRFEHECWNYHTYIGQIDNKEHPRPPAGSSLSCPLTVCALFSHK